VDPFSYLSVLISVILALGMTRVLAGVGEMLQARWRRQIYWVHAVWIANLFIYLIVAWWVFYRWRYQQQWTFFSSSSCADLTNDPVPRFTATFPAGRLG
jgi:hypothetical protein